ncbi:MAG: GIY-YIG nuclease family protein [Armatimonadetes bacterium]|nr:GIY-YIG nuclease family protein [Armatimonadota bacterium]
MAVTVYVLKSHRSGRRYVGITGDLGRRLREHASGRSGGGRLSGGFALIHTEEYPDYETARVRERFLKSGQGRKWLDETEAGSRPAGGG